MVEYMRVRMAWSVKDLLKVVLVQNLWLACTGAYDAGLHNLLNTEGTQEAGPVGQVDLEFGAVPRIFINPKRLDRLT